MTQGPQGNGAHDAFFHPWMDFWSRCLEQGREQTQVLLDSLSGTRDAEALRRRWLESLAQSLDSFLRSPAFLEAMRRNFELITEVKSNSEEVAQEVARTTGLPRLPDISGLFERLRLAQDVILDRLTAIERRLEALEAHDRNAKGRGRERSTEGPGV
jgi:hypothetical protein